MTGGPTRSWIESYTTAHLWDALPKIKARSEQVEQAYRDQLAKVGAPGGTQWTGQMQGAAEDRAQGDLKVAIRHCDVKDRAQAAIENAAHEGESLHRLAVEAIEAAKRQGFTVTEELRVIDTQPCSNSKESDERALKAKTAEDYLKARANDLWASDQGLGKKLTELAAELDSHQFPAENGAQTVDVNSKPGDPQTQRLRDALFAGVGGNPAATTAAEATPTGTPANPSDLLDKSLPKPQADPNAGRLIDSVARLDPSALAKRSWVEKIPGVTADPNSPQGKAAADTLRSMYKAQGVPPAQIEAKVQQDLKNAAQDRYEVHFNDPNNVNRAPSGDLQRPFGDQFNDFTNRVSDSALDTVKGQVQEIKNLAGQGGPGQPGAAEAWKELGLGAVKGAPDMLNPLHGAVQDAKDLYNDPAQFLGKKAIEIPEALATLPLGGEGAALTDARALTTHGLEDMAHVPPSTIDHHVPTGGDHTPVSGDHSPPTGHLPETGDPGSFGYDADGNRMPYANHRPGYGSGQVADVWNQSREAQLGQIDRGELNLPRPGSDQQWVELHPKGPIGEDWNVENGHRLVEWQPGDPRRGLWDMGHLPGQEYGGPGGLRDQYLRGEISYDEFMRDYRNPANYQVQDPYRNQSHYDEER